MLNALPSVVTEDTGRLDPYRLAHKGIRMTLGRLLETAGRTDFADRDAVDRMRRQSLEAIEIVRTHARLEVLFVDSLLKSSAPESFRVEREHAELEHQLLSLVLDVHCAAQAGRVEMRARGHAFYLALSRFIALYYLHMVEEETRALPLLHGRVDDETLHRTVLAAQSSVTTEQGTPTAKAILDAIAPHEHAAIAVEPVKPSRAQVDRSDEDRRHHGRRPPLSRTP